MCKYGKHQEIEDTVSSINLTDNGGDLVYKDWKRIQAGVYHILASNIIPDWCTYLRITTLLGWTGYFPKAENFPCPVLDIFRNGGKEINIPYRNWMRLEHRAYIDKANAAL
jgi:hypothetical protein